MGNGESRSFTRCPGGSVVVEGGVGGPTLDAESMAKMKMKSMASRETVDDRLERYIKDFTLEPYRLRKMMDAFIDELQLGLELWREGTRDGFDPAKPVIDSKLCSLKMLDSCVKELPTGDEEGVYYALDFGGTNFRAVRLSMKGKGKMDFTQIKESLTASSDHSKGLMDSTATATELFDFFAKTMKKFMKQQGDIDDKGDDSSSSSSSSSHGAKKFGVGFTFSFPCTLRKLDSAVLIVWTKHLETGRKTNDKVEGQDVGELLDQAFKRNHVPMKCVAVMNDTVGTLLSCAYEKPSELPPCLVGIILGTGMNACYYDETCSLYNYQGNIVNLECGNFNRELPRTNIDTDCDFHAHSNRGQQMLEKMISGAYVGEVCRRTIVKVYQHVVPEAAWQMFSLPAEDAAQIVVDKTDNCVQVQKILKDKWGVPMSADHCMGIQRICRAVFDRSAALAAVVIASCAQKTGKLQPAMGGLTVGVDGSLYKLNKFYRDDVRKHLEGILGDHHKLIHLDLADDGSGKGAGIVASTIRI